jgi:hypothetical protein
VQGSGLFVGAMEMIHKWQGDHKALKGATNASHAKLYPTTCEGELAADPIFAVSMEQCAEACNTYTHSGDDNYCIGFQHFYMGDLDIQPAGTTNTAGGECEDYLGSAWGSSCAELADFVKSEHDGIKQWYDAIKYYWGTVAVEWGCNGCSMDPYYEYYFQANLYYYFGTSVEATGPCSTEEKRAAALGGGGRCNVPWRNPGERSIFGAIGYYMNWNFYYVYYYETGDVVSMRTAIYGHDYYDYYIKAADACCAAGGGYTPPMPSTPDTGICLLFSSIDHVYKYDCGEPSECVDFDYESAVAALPENIGVGRTCQDFVDNPNMAAGMMGSLQCGGMSEGQRRYQHDAWVFSNIHLAGTPVDQNGNWIHEAVAGAPPFWEGCCEIKEAYPNGLDDIDCGDKKLLLDQNTTNVTKALLSHKHETAHAKKHEKAHAKKHERKHKKVAKKESEGAKNVEFLAHPPAQLSTPNVCKVRASWNIAAPRKPEFENLNTCLDTGELVLGNSATGKKKKK